MPDSTPQTPPAEGEKKEEKKSTKNRVGRNKVVTDGAPVEKKVIVRKSRWGKFLAEYKGEHPELCSVEATIAARKVYKPANGKNKSFERIFTEVWRQRNPHWAKMDKKERAQRIRDDFIKAI